MTRERLELVVALIAGIAGVLGAWAAFESASWNSIKTFAMADSSLAARDATEARLRMQSESAVDVMLVEAYVEATVAGNDRLAAYYRAHVPPRLRPAFEEWVARPPGESAQGPATPLQSPSYQADEVRRVAALDARVSAKRADGEAASRYADRYLLGSVLVALALLLAGMSPRFHHDRAALFVAVAAAMLEVVAVGFLAWLPSASLG